MGGEVFFFFPNWTMVQGKILIVDNLKYHKKIIIDWCFMCKACEEMVNHFLYCATARTLGKYFSIFWIFWAESFGMLERWLQNIKVVMCEILYLYAYCSIWREKW